MLRKLLKYDFGAVIKLWCIGALTVLVLGVIGGFCQLILFSGRQLHSIIYLTAGFGEFVSGLGLSVFSLLTTILLAVRFYRNFFTDEGYLTFTLPVKLHKLINSKLIMTMVMMLLTSMVLILAMFIQTAVSTENFGQELKNFWTDMRLSWNMSKVKGWIILYIFEGLMITFFSTLFSTLFLYCCITFGSIVAKRAKVVAGIGIYLGANFVFALVTIIFLTFGVVTFALWVENTGIDEAMAWPIIAIVLFGVAALQAMLCSLLYTLQYRLLDRKLNLP